MQRHTNTLNGCINQMDHVSPTIDQVWGERLQVPLYRGGARMERHIRNWLKLTDAQLSEFMDNIL
jgi:hypothetical protein